MSRVRGIRRLNAWLWQGCRRLSSKQQQKIVYLLCGVYLLLSVYMIAQLFTPKCEAQNSVPIVEGREMLLDSPIGIERKDLVDVVLPDALLTENENEQVNIEIYGNR